jgi:hypothetical protein
MQKLLLTIFVIVLIQTLPTESHKWRKWMESIEWNGRHRDTL